MTDKIRWYAGMAFRNDGLIERYRYDANNQPTLIDAPEIEHVTSIISDMTRQLTETLTVSLEQLAASNALNHSAPLHTGGTITTDSIPLIDTKGREAIVPRKLS